MESITIYDNKGNKVAILSDEKPMLGEGYDIKATLYNHDGSRPDSIVRPGDMLYYGEQPDLLFIVSDCDERFFTMARLTLNVKGDLSIDYGYRRTYPNSSYIGSLEDYGLKLKEEAEENDENQKSKEKDGS